MVVPEQCTKSSVLTVVRRLKFLSSQQKVDQFTAGTVTRSIEGTRSPLKGGLGTLPSFLYPERVYERREFLEDFLVPAEPAFLSVGSLLSREDGRRFSVETFFLVA